MKDGQEAKAETCCRAAGYKVHLQGCQPMSSEESVIGNFCSEYSCGRTPNPCIVCNPGDKVQGAAGDCGSGGCAVT